MQRKIVKCKHNLLGIITKKESLQTVERSIQISAAKAREKI